MATLNISFSITSSDTTSVPLSLDPSDTLSVTHPLGDTLRASVLHTAETVIVSSSASDDTFVYIKNTDATNFVTLSNDAGDEFGVLNAGEFAFLPVKAGAGLEVQADTAACVIEYGYWTRS